MAPLELIERLQRRLEALYDLCLPWRASEHVFSDPTLARQLKRSPNLAPEELLVLELDQAIHLSLYLDAAVLDRLGQAQTDQDRLPDLLLVAEGISHFVYLAWNAARARPVSLFELELQAEVDKFALLSRRLSGQGLLARLFEGVSYRPGLSTEAEHRYRRAHRHAARYCHALERRFPRPGTARLNELRRFWRLSQRAKLDRVDAVANARG